MPDVAGWIFRRDQQRIRRPYREIIRRTDDGIPYLAIEAVLLFKAKHPRDKDEADFTRRTADAVPGRTRLAGRDARPGSP